MPITLAVPKEILAGEQRVALVPAVAAKLADQGAIVRIEQGAGAGIRTPDSAYVGAELTIDAAAAFKGAQVILKVQPPTLAEIDLMPEEAILIGFLAPHSHPEEVKRLQSRRITAFAVELIPRISRAQSMDALSSQAAVAGYKAALMGASLLGRFFPMLTTAAGTIRPAKVLVIGAGVAGLQAIATAKRLGAQVEGYDVRSAAKEQVESLGAKFVALDVKADAAGGYARELTDEEKQKQQALLAQHIAKADVVICTAAIPGRAAPKIVSEDMVRGMKSGAVIVDLAAETGGNCALTAPGETIQVGDVVIHGPLNVPSSMAEHASEMYAKNLQNFLGLMLKDGTLTLNWEDEILAKSVVTHAGEIKHEPTRQMIEGGTP
ncbi:MAG TPA: Re/Si-specific NAD(P)(+) transhydrogenase subunit alpha [Candidatus Macondimonas sp.]|nr:Re/Si-specific NAD(P)(+) transhydrogenase subunit alpha [Candidatus Macondimonas sp.]